MSAQGSITDKAVDELIDGIKRRIGSAVLHTDASPQWYRDSLLGMQRFVIEWEKRHPASPPEESRR